MNCSPNPENQIDEAVTQELQTAVEKLAQLKLSDEAEAFLLSELYIQYGLNTKAIEQLEALVNAESRVATVPQKKDEVRRMITEAKSEDVALRAVEQSSNVQERLTGLLGEVQALRSFSSCGQCQDGNGDGRWQWNPPKWECRGC